MPRRRDPNAAPVLHRTARIGLRLTRGQRERCYGLLRSAGDLWGCVLELNGWRRQRGDKPATGYQELCGLLTAAGPGTFGELDTAGARSVLRRYSDSWFSAAKRRRAGDLHIRFPRRRRALLPVRFYHRTFTLDERRLRLPTAAGRPPLRLRLSRPAPYPVETIRSVTLLSDKGRLWMEVTAEVPLQTYPPDARPERDRTARAPSGGRRSSRRWRKTRRRARLIESRHRRRIRQAQHEAAKSVVRWAVEQRIGTLTVGDPRGVLDRDAGPRHNLRLRQWQVGRAFAALRDKAELAGILVHLVDERGTSSTCPRCARKVAKPRGRTLTCRTCSFTGHRDVVAASTIATRTPGGAITTPHTIGVVTHRRAGRHLPGLSRRDPRRRPRAAATGSVGLLGPAPPSGGESLARRDCGEDRHAPPAGCASPKQQ